MQKFKSVEELVNQLKPEKPVYCIRKNSIQSATKFFKNNFPGKILYAVKTNPHPVVIKQIIESGVDQFDVASIEEIRSIRNFSHTAKCSYMHTVKSRESIRDAYFKYNVKSFSLDTKEELIKITFVPPNGASCHHLARWDQGSVQNFVAEVTRGVSPYPPPGNAGPDWPAGFG